MQHQFSISSSSGNPDHHIRFVIRDNWLDNSAPMFEIEAQAKSPRGNTSNKTFVERAVIDANKTSVMVEQTHGGASAYFVSSHRDDREIHQELSIRVGQWVERLTNHLEMALEGDAHFFESEMRDLITRLESHLQFQENESPDIEGVRDRRELIPLDVKMKTILLRMNCSSLMFLIHQKHVNEDSGEKLLEDAKWVFDGLAERDENKQNKDNVYSMASQAVGIIEKYSKKELDKLAEEAL